MQTPPSGRRLSSRIQLESSPPATCVCGCSNIPLSNFSIASCPPGRHLLAPAPSLFLCAAASFCFAIFVCRPPSLCRTLERRVTDTKCGHDDVGAPLVVVRRPLTWLLRRRRSLSRPLTGQRSAPFDAASPAHRSRHFSVPRRVECNMDSGLVVPVS